MGRSEKKIKSERINIIKKQYDAFLEEDKKRKERNGYILEKLDKMRYCNAVVQVRKKPGIINDDRNGAYYNITKQTLQSPLVSTIDVKHIPTKDESMLLKEICKKYILIPKLRSMCTDDYIQEIKPKIDENNDWKSKYEILEQLKKSEKGDLPYSPPETYFLNVEKDTGQHIVVTPTTNKDDHSLYLNEQQQSENVMPYKTQDYIETDNYVENINDYDNNDKRAKESIENSQPQIKKSYEVKCNTSDSKQNIVTKDLHTNKNMQHDVELYSSINNDVHMDYIAETTHDNNIEIIDEVVDKMTINDNKDNYQNNLVKTLPIQEINPSDLNTEMNNDFQPEVTTDALEHLEYPIQMINPRDHIPSDVPLQDGEVIKSDPHVFITDGTNAVYADNNTTVVNDDKESTVNPLDPIIIDNSGNTGSIIETGNNEQLNENYVYTQEVQNENEESSAPADTYQQEEYTTYYEGAQPEQGFSSEINENEETLQRYDQNYEQQYGADYEGETYQQQEYDQQYPQQGFEQYPQQGYEQQYSQQGFEQYSQEGYEQNYAGQHLEYDTQQEQLNQAQGDQYENQNLTPQFLEQQLDNEDGYTEKQNENIEINNIEKVLDTQQVPAEVDEQINAH